MESEGTYVNEFTARGIVLNIGYNEYHKRVLTLLVRERRDNTLKLDINLEKEIGRGIYPKDRIVVSGYTRGFTYHNDALGKDSEVMYFVGTAIEKETTELSKRFGGEIGTFYPEPVFRSFVSGKIVNIVPPTDKNAWAKITVKTSGGGSDLRASNVILRYYTGGRLPVFDYQEGDAICCRLSAYTPEKEMKSGRIIRFQNLNVEDIAYQYKVQRKTDKTVKFDIDAGLDDCYEGNKSSIQAEEQNLNPVESNFEPDEIYADDTELINESL